MGIQISRITAADLADVISMMRAFAAYEDLLEYCTATEKGLHTAMFGNGAFVEGLIIRDGRRPVGYSIFHASFSSFRAERGLYLEDLYVNAEYRRQDLGHLMLKTIAARAVELGYERIDFMVLDWNEPAISFYLKHGAEKNDDESHFKFAGEAFRRLAAIN
jgi:ribosomal protein S18 acetylase RimI-like enzyme